jgi:hypothetical protein
MVAFTTSAEVINTDWLSPGDNLIISDTATKLEFLKISETKGLSVSQVSALFGTTYLGWRLPTNDEVGSMLTNLLADAGGYSLVTAHYTMNIEDKPNTTGFNYYLDDTSQRYVFGLVKSEESVIMSGFRVGNTGEQITYNNHLESIYSLNYSHSNYGVWLIRDAVGAVNVPAPLALSGLALLGLGLIRRKKPV